MTHQDQREPVLSGHNSFLCLPAEIRMIIYEIALDQLLVSDQPYPTAGETWLPVCQRQITCMRTFCSLLDTNHQVVGEVTSLFLKYLPNLTFYLDSGAALNLLKGMGRNLIFNTHVRETRFSVRCGSTTPSAIRRESVALAAPSGALNVPYGLVTGEMYDNDQKELEKLVVSHTGDRPEYVRRMTLFLLPTPGSQPTFRSLESEGYDHTVHDESQDGSIPGYHKVAFPRAMWKEEDTSLTLTGYRWRYTDPLLRPADQGRNAWDGCVVLEGKLGDIMPRFNTRAEMHSDFLDRLLDRCSKELAKLR